ncbi:MAG: hypothetical protein J7K94_03635 [Dehalococcoidia bacterium]|nr:hypothetical protein [Dehalococcoidia bacterium]
MLKQKKDMENRMEKQLLEEVKSLRREVALLEESDEVLLWRERLRYWL